MILEIDLAADRLQEQALLKGRDKINLTAV
jgi:hypothetical protein